MKYYYPENLRRYAWVDRDEVPADSSIGRDGDPNGAAYANFQTREFLEAVIPLLHFNTSSPTVLEYGCGTGAAACFLAERGFEVHAIDLIPAAIKTAKSMTRERGLDIVFEVADVCELSHAGIQYDMIVDSYCLQHIVFDIERAKLYEAVGSRLQVGGYYVVSSVILDKQHEEPISEETVEDPGTGIVYNRYGTGLIELGKGIVLRAFEPKTNELPDLCQIEGPTYLPYRRYLCPDDLISEIEAAGFSSTMRDARFPGSFFFTPKAD